MSEEEIKGYYYQNIWQTEEDGFLDQEKEEELATEEGLVKYITDMGLVDLNWSRFVKQAELCGIDIDSLKKTRREATEEDEKLLHLPHPYQLDFEILILYIYEFKRYKLVEWYDADYQHKKVYHKLQLYIKVRKTISEILTEAEIEFREFKFEGHKVGGSKGFPESTGQYTTIHGTYSRFLAGRGKVTDNGVIWVKLWEWDTESDDPAFPDYYVCYYVKEQDYEAAVQLLTRVYEGFLMPWW